MVDSSALEELRQLMPIAKEPSIRSALALYREALKVAAAQQPRRHPAGLDLKNVSPVRVDRFLSQIDSGAGQARKAVRAAVITVVDQRWRQWTRVIAFGTRERKILSVSANALSKMPSSVKTFEGAAPVAETARDVDLGLLAFAPTELITSSDIRDRLRLVHKEDFNRRRGNDLCTAIALNEFETRSPVIRDPHASEEQMRSWQTAAIRDASPPALAASASKGQTNFELEDGRLRLLAHMLCGSHTLCFQTTFSSFGRPEEIVTMRELGERRINVPSPKSPFVTSDAFVLGLNLHQD